MATDKNIRINTGAPDAKTFIHRVMMADRIDRVKRMVCKACGFTPSLYDELHYNLAEEWFRYHNYLEYTAKVFLLSAIFHRWWNQQVAMFEDQFLFQHSHLAPGQLRIALTRAIIEMDIHPSAELRREMHNEGMAMLRDNPELNTIKIYRDGPAETVTEGH